MNAPASIELQDAIGKIQSHAEALAVFAFGLGQIDSRASNGMSVLVDALEEAIGKARALAEGDTPDEGEAS